MEKFRRLSAPHRRLRIGSRGNDVERFQVALRERLSKSPSAGDVPAPPTGGEIFENTLRPWRHVRYWLGLPAESIEDGHPMTVGAQRAVRWPWARTPAARARARKRRKDHAAQAPRRAVEWAEDQIGTVEDPPGSNKGGKITVWQQALGAWLVGAAWCGTFVGNALRAAGVVGINYRVASVAYIEDDAKAGRNGWKAWVNKLRGKAGDAVILFGRGVHVEFIVRRRWWGYETVGGNTSPEGSSGSQSNGGCVAPRKRYWWAVYGVARPNYPKGA